MTNPFTKDPFREDYKRHRKLRSFVSFEHGESYLFAEALDRASARRMAKQIASAFGLVPRIERLSVTQIWTWLVDYEDDGEETPRETPLIEWTSCEEPYVWAISLSKNKKSKLGELWARWNLSPFTSETAFDQWFLEHKEGLEPVGIDPAYEYWLATASEEERDREDYRD